VQELGEHVVPHRLRLLQERVALGAEGREIDPAQQLEAGVVVAREAEILGDVALTLEALATHRRELALDECRAGSVDLMALAHRRGIRELDRDALIFQLATVGEPNDGAPFPGDLALVERRQRARAL